MPHIVFDKKINLQEFSKKFNPIFQKTSQLITINNIFIDRYALTALLPCIVISEINQNFLIEISTSNSKTTIRLYSYINPVKTDGVKNAMALLAKQIMDVNPEFKVTKTNLSGYLDVAVSS